MRRSGRRVFQLRFCRIRSTLVHGRPPTTAGLTVNVTVSVTVSVSLLWLQGDPGGPFATTSNASALRCCQLAPLVPAYASSTLAKCWADTRTSSRYSACFSLISP